MAPVLRVGIFGFYSYRNLGDNLMAYLFANHVKDIGHEPIIYTKDIDPKRWGYPLCANIVEFVEASDVIIFGGGGLLIPRPQPSIMGKDFNDDLGDLLEYTKDKSIPLFALSIGGVGDDIDNIEPMARQELIKRVDYVTLRNRQDLKLLAQAHTNGEFLDDVVWTTSRKFPARKSYKGNSRIRVGVNLYLGSSRRSRLARRALSILTWCRRDVDFIFYDIHPNQEGNFGAHRDNINRKNCTTKVLTDVEEACTEASLLDMLITSRLHFGVVAMSYGVPCIAFSAAEKTKILYDHINKSSHFWKNYHIHKLIFLFLFPGALKQFLRTQNNVIQPSVIDNAMQHYARLSRLLESVIRRTSRSTFQSG